MDGPLWLLVNAASGSNSAEAVSAVQAGFAAAGRSPALVRDIAEGLPARHALEQAGVGTLAVFAGDGTITAAATALEGWAGALLPLPGGTTNLLARALHGERPAPEIAAAAARLVRTRRTCIRTACGPALAEVLAGPGARWSEVREGLREGAVGEVAGTAVAAIRESMTGPMVRLVAPALGHPEGYAGLLLSPTGAGMAVAGYRADGPGDLLAHGMALLRRNFREGPHDALGLHEEVQCRAADGATPIALMIDGERRDGGAAELFSLAPFALDLLGLPG